MEQYMYNKMVYLGLKKRDMRGGAKTETKTKTKSKSGPMMNNIFNHVCRDNKNETEIYDKISEIAKKEINSLKRISLKDLHGLNLRLYDRNGEKTISPIVFRTAKITEYLNNIDNDCKDVDKGKKTSCKIDLNSFKYMNYHDNNFGDITKNKLKDLIIDFDTKDTKIRLAFYDNYVKGRKEYFEIQQPIKLVDLIEKIFDHFDKVKLPGYPDNGGIDWIEYDKKNDIYLIHTWS